MGGKGVRALYGQVRPWPFRLILQVPSEFNISDCPSRFEYKILEDVDAVWRSPKIAKLYLGNVER